MTKTALIAGATGLVGSELLKLLVESKAYDEIHVLNRSTQNYSSSRITEHVIDFEKLAIFDPGGPVHHVFCCLGTTIKKAKIKENFRKVDFDYVLALAKRVKVFKATRFLVISSLGANAKSTIFYNRVKGEMEEALKEIDLPQLFIFRPSLLMGNRKESRPGEKTAILVYKVINPLFIRRLKKYKGISIKKVARAMIDTALYNDSPYKIFESDEIQNF